MEIPLTRYLRSIIPKGLVLLLLLLLSTPSFASEPAEILVAVRLNGQLASDFEPALKDDSHWYLSVDFFRRNRLSLPPTSPMLHGKQEYYPLDDVSGLTFSVDMQEQALNIKVPPGAFGLSRTDASRRMRLLPTVSGPGAFLNRDLQYLVGHNLNEFSGFGEAGFFGPSGVVTSEFSAVAGTNGFQTARINTLFTHDIPDRLVTFTVGDSMTSGEMWGRQAYFAGISYSTNFAVQPSFIPEALPSISGIAVAPSVVNIYADNVEVLSQPVDSGPFAIQNIPVMSGEGQIQLVVTDALGRSQTITQPFIKSTDILQQGVRDFAYQAGTFRRNYGVTSAQYKSFFLLGSERRGITDSLTLGARAELTGANEALGSSASYVLRRLGVLGGGTVLSLNGSRPGNLSYVDFDHAARAFGLAFHYETATPGFWQIGLLPSEANGRHLFQGSTSIAVGNYATVSVGLIQEVLHGAGDLRSLTATAGVRMGPGYLNITPTISTAPRRATGVNFSFSMPFGRRGIIFSTAETGNAGRSAITEIQTTLPTGTGYGYRVRSDELNNGRVDAELSYQNDHGEWDVETSQGDQANSWRLSDRAGIAWLHGNVLTTRWLENSFAMVEVPHEPNVGVFVNNLQVARTNRNGVALVPWLAPYDHNSIRIDDSAISMDTLLDVSDKTVVPMFRSGVLVQFAPQKSTGAIVILKMDSGELIPVGATVAIDGAVRAHVAFHGEAFLPSLKAPARLHVEWAAHACDVTVSALPNELLPRIGPLTCGGNK
jgi:outer membrane usher protein